MAYSKISSDIFLDANIVLEIFTQRGRWEEVQKIVSQYEIKYVSPITVGILFYYAEKLKINIQDAEKFIDHCVILPMNESTYKLAKKIYNHKDMEDGLQVATALENNVQTIITLDKDFQKKYQNLLTVIGV